MPFHWRIIALQYCVGFYCTIKWVSPNYKYTFPLVSLPLPSHRMCLGPHREPGWAPWAVQRFPLTPFFTCSTHRSMLLCQFIPPSPSPAASTSLFLHLHLHSFPTNRLICPIFLDAIHMHDIQYLFFSFWVSSLCITDSRFIYLTTSDWDSFLFWLSDVSLCVCTTSSLSIHLAVDIQVASMSCLV